MRYLVIVVGLLVLAVGATWVHYQSLSPCVWLERDMVERTGLPPLVVRARITAEFLVKGISEPGPYDCLLEWWTFRIDSSPTER